MKFTNGYWMTKPEYDVLFAAEYFSARRIGDALEVLVSTRPIGHRGDVINSGTFTLRFTAPAPGIIRVKAEHFRGTVDHGPHFPLLTEEVTPVIEETETSWIFRSGRASAVIAKDKWHWRVDFCGDDRVLTNSGWRGLAHAENRAAGKAYMIDSLELDVGEKVYGLGERFTALVKNGQSVDMWNGDGGTASEMAYKNIPFFMTNRGWGAFVESSSDVSFEVASEKVERVQFSLQGESMTWDFIYGGDAQGVVERYTALTGRPAMPPAWSFGLWLSTSFTTDYDEKTVTSMIDGMAQRDIPLSVFHFDCYWMKAYHWTDFTWDEKTFPDPAGFLARLKARGLHICCWINPYIAQAGDIFDEAMERGYLLLKDNGDVWQTDMWQAGMGILDVTNPAARAWFTAHLDRLMDLGVDTFKTDFGERIPVRGVKWHDGSDPVKMHNHYSYLYNKMVFDALEKRRGRGDALVFARSATACGQTLPVHWNGDSTATYASMAETLRSGLSLAQCGFGFWSHDISGFEQTAPAHVYKRWAAFGLLCSHSRLHGSTSYRVPWLFDEESCEVLRRFTRLKCSLMPYLYQAAAESHLTGVPMLRPMMMSFPGDIAAEACETQYMLGGSLLAAPIFHKDGHVDYYLPAGKWTNILTGEVVEGGRWVRETHGFMTLPLMAAPGSVIPMGVRDDRPDYDYADGVTLHVYQPADGEVTVTVPDLTGAPAAAFRVIMKGGQVTVETDSGKPYTVVVH
ncbi:MAG: alpha-xylosidase [Clostridia bacterium]|nr:alpha-xylosidase [Clostridia bacterium]